MKEIINDQNFKAGWLLVCNSILIIIVNGLLMFYLGLGIGSMYSPFSLCGIILVPVVIGVVYFQFDSTFRNNKDSARNISILYFMGAGFALFALVSNLVEGFMDKGQSKESLLEFAIEFGSVSLVVFTYLIFSGILNLLWKKKLKTNISANLRDYSFLQSKKIMPVFISLFVVIFFVGVVFGYLYGERYEFAEEVENVSWLPDSASNISYYKSYNYTAYEFDISEEAFLRWAKDHHWNVSKIDKSITISRYNYYLVQESKSDPEFWEKVYVTINTGYFYQWERGQSGGGIDVAFDSATNRAYYQHNPR
jgi:hypothetical protein